MEVEGVGTFVVGNITPRGVNGRFDVTLARKFESSLTLFVRKMP